MKTNIRHIHNYVCRVVVVTHRRSTPTVLLHRLEVDFFRAENINLPPNFAPDTYTIFIILFVEQQVLPIEGLLRLQFFSISWQLISFKQKILTYLQILHAIPILMRLQKLIDLILADFVCIMTGTDALLIYNLINICILLKYSAIMDQWSFTMLCYMHKLFHSKKKRFHCSHSKYI